MLEEYGTGSEWLGGAYAASFISLYVLFVVSKFEQKKLFLPSSKVGDEKFWG